MDYRSVLLLLYYLVVVLRYYMYVLQPLSVVPNLCVEKLHLKNIFHTTLIFLSSESRLSFQENSLTRGQGDAERSRARSHSESIVCNAFAIASASGEEGVHGASLVSMLAHGDPSRWLGWSDGGCGRSLPVCTFAPKRGEVFGDVYTHNRGVDTRGKSLTLTVVLSIISADKFSPFLISVVYRCLLSVFCLRCTFPVGGESALPISNIGSRAPP